MKTVKWCALGVFLLVHTLCSAAQAETPGEILGRAFKDLQARHDEVAAEQPGGGKNKQGARQRQKQEESELRKALENLDSAQKNLAAGQPDAALRALGEVRGNGKVPPEIKGSLDTVITTLEKDRAAVEAELVAKIDAACRRAGDAALRANAPKDVDGNIQELNRLSTQDALSRGPFSDTLHKSQERLRTGIIFLQRWQEYLAARQQHDGNAMNSALHDLARQTYEPPLVPRGEIYARMPKEENNGDPDRPFRSVTQINAAAVEIVQNTKKVEDVPGSLGRLMALKRELEASPAVKSYAGDPDLFAALLQMDVLNKNLTSLQLGLGGRVNFNDGSLLQLGPHPEIDAAVLSLRLQIIALAAPQMLGAPAGDKPAPNETTAVYLNRLIDAADKRQDWDAVERGLELREALAGAASNRPVMSYDPELDAIRYYRSGSNNEKAGRYKEAVIDYRAALEHGRPRAFITSIGTSLAAIEKDHPKEYAEAIKPPRQPVNTLADPFGGLTGATSRTITLPLPSPTASPGLISPTPAGTP